MMKDEFIQSSPVASIIYTSDIEVHEDSLRNYAYALMVVAGADGVVSKEEMEWIESEFLEVLKVPEELKDDIRNFDFKKADLEYILDNINLNIPLNYRRALVYDAVQMARADHEYALEEKEAVRHAAQMLGVPFYLARAIEGLVNTERSIEITRKSIFETDSSRDINDHLLMGSRPTSVIMKNIFGMHYMDKENLLNYGYALMIIAGADGEVSESEKEWFRMRFAKLAGLPDELVSEILSYDYQGVPLEDVLEKVKSDVSVNLARTLLYNAIKMARADNDYPSSEQRAVRKAAEILGIKSEVANTIEYLIDTEDKVGKMRRTLFEYQI